MKKTITLLAILFAVNVFATDRFVDSNLSQGNGTTLFTTITSAVAAAVNGDRIIILPSTYNEAELTINKSLQIIPQTAGATINFNANIVVNGFAGMNLEIIGFNLGVYNINSNQAGSMSNRAKVSIINCSMNNLNLNVEGFECYILSNNISGQILARFGYFVSNYISDLYILDEAAENPNNSDEKILIVNNDISNRLYIYNNTTRFVIANNELNTIAIKRWNANTNLTNYIFNNNFNISKLIVSTVNVPNYNLTFTNNLGIASFYTGGSSYQTNHLDYNSRNAEDIIFNPWYYTETSNSNLTTSLFPDNDISGFFEWTYNNQLVPRSAPSSNQPLSFVNDYAGNSTVNGGNPNHKYYDIDLTINDRGINGGPYSQLNYNASNPNISRAFIFDLEMPVDLFPGQNIEIKAKGYHSN
tara:strand:- start:366 stop:1610 length:1245 start_codon:yes stop_codon:yes gene_type:complete